MLVAGIAATVVTGCKGTPSHDTHGDPQQGEAAQVRMDVQRHRVPVTSDEHALGAEQPLVTIVLFTDYACPPCAATWKVMENLVEDYPGDLRVVVRSFTVPGFGRGEHAAEAAQAAGAQGKFWEMHRRLFEQAPAFDRPTLTAHAEAIGLDVARFLDDLDTGVYASTHLQHRRDAKRLGLVGIPAAFVDGIYVAGFADEDAWHGLVDQELRHVREMLATGVRRGELYDEIMAKASTRRVQTSAEEKALQAEVAERKAADEQTPARVAPRGDRRYRIEPEGPTMGADDAPIVVVEFVDYQCPYCRRAWTDELAAWAGELPDDVRFAVRQLPLAVHSAARGASIASLAAHAQGKFWPYQDRLLRHTGPLGRSVFVEMAASLGLDTERFVADLDDPKLAAQVDRDEAVADAVGVGGTPGFFVNGRFASGFRPGQIPAMVDEERREVARRVAQGLAPGEVFSALMDEAVQPSAFENRQEN